MAGRRHGGGIFGLLDLIDRHRGALEYDWRTRFPGVTEGLAAVPDAMGWDEALRLVRILRADPSSAIAAALEGWDYPISREALGILDLFDLTLAANSDPKRGRPKPHGGRPFKAALETTQRGKAIPLSEARERFRRDFGREIPA